MKCLAAFVLILDNVAAACGPAKMNPKYVDGRFKFKNISITYEDQDVLVTGLATGDLGTGCLSCSKQVFIQIFNKSSSSYVGVKQIRCDYGRGMDFQPFTVKYNLPPASFEGHDFELRASDTWSYCETFDGNFDPDAGYGTQHGEFASVNCAPKPGPKLLKCPAVGGSTECCEHKVAADKNETCSFLSNFYDTSNLRILHGDGETICSDKFAPPQPKEKLRVCPNYACAKGSCIGGAMMPESNGTFSKIDCALKCARPTRTCTPPQKDSTASKSANIDTFQTPDPEACRQRCLSNEKCTAYNHIYTWAIPQCFLHSSPAVGGLPSFGQYSGTCSNAE